MKIITNFLNKRKEKRKAKKIAMAQKFIINDNKFLMGRVEYHRELAKDHKTTQGGGFWHIDRHKKILYLCGESSDFGRSDKQVIIDALKKGFKALSLHGFKVMYSPSLKMEDAVNNGEVIIEKLNSL